MLFIEGKLHINSRTNKDGQQVSIPEIIANKVLFTKNKTEDPFEYKENMAIPSIQEEFKVDTLPF